MRDVSKVDSGLYVAGCVHKLPTDVLAIVDLQADAGWLPMEGAQSMAWFPIGDEFPGNVWLHMVVKVIAAYRQAGWGVLITCEDGNDRSGLLACAVVMWERGLSRETALEFLRKSRASIALNDSFWLGLLAWDMFLRKAERTGCL